MRSIIALAVGLFLFAAGPQAKAASDGQLAEMLLAATPSALDIRKASEIDGWWPEPAEFLGRLDPATGLRTLILQSFRLPEQGTRERIMMAVSAYVSREAASARFNDMEPQDARTYGQQTSTFALGHEQARLHISARPRGQTLRVQEGRYILRVTHWTDGALLKPAQMMALVGQAVERLGELEREKRPLPAPPPLVHLLPGETDKLGKPMGTAAGPIEWAAFNRAEGENIPDPRLRDLLKTQMRPQQVTLRRWPLSGSQNGQVVEALLFRMADSRSAENYLQFDRENRSADRMRASPVERWPSYIEKQSGERGSRITLVMAKQRLVALLSCGAPYFYAAPECEAALRQLAESIAATER